MEVVKSDAAKGEAPFSGLRLRVSRIFRGWTQQDLAERVAVRQPYIACLEAGTKLPSDQMLQALGDVMGFDAGYFAGPVEEFRDEECHFRRRATTAVSARNRALAQGTLYGLFVAFLDNAVELPEYDIPTIKISSKEDIEQAAEACRQRWDLGIDTPIPNAIRVVENFGAITTLFEGISDKVDAFSRIGASNRSIIVINANQPASRQRWDVAHELGHIVMHAGIDAGNSDLEDQAHYFAGAFLLPRRGFIREFPRAVRKVEELFPLKTRWRVSLAAMIRRAYELKIIDAAQYQRFYKYIHWKGWHKDEPCEFPAEPPELQRESMQFLADEFGYTSSSVAKSLRWKQESLREIVGNWITEFDPPSDGLGGPNSQVVFLDHERSRRQG